MGRFLINLKKTLICAMALATSASMMVPVSVYAAETTSEVGVDNHTQGRENAKTVSGITIGDVTAPKEGERLDDTAVVTTAEGETWEIPVIWIGEDLKPDTGLAGKGSYLPVLAYVVPDEYTVRSDDASGRGYKITLSEDLLKLFGEDKIISVYENKTRITYIIPAKLKDLFARKGTVKNPEDEGGNEIIPADQVAPYQDEADEEPAQEQEEEPAQEQEEEPAQEQEEEPAEEDDTQEGYSHIVNVHCDQNAKDALSNSDLEFLADLVVNTLQPQAVNLLIEKFPAFKEAAENRQIGRYITVVISCDEGSSVGRTATGTTTDDSQPDRKFCYSLIVNADPLIDHKENDKAVITRDVNSAALTDLANTIVHELFHCVSFDYNRPGLTGRIRDGNTLLPYSADVEFPAWFVEGTATTVENNWQFRQEALKILRTPFQSEVPNVDYNKALLLERYVDGVYKMDESGNYKCDYNFDIEYCNGKDRYGIECSDTASRYVSGYLACMYLYELAAAKDPAIGTSRSTRGENTVISSEKLRLGMDSIIRRMHEGETLDQVIKDISDGAYEDTAAFESQFIKGRKGEDDKYGEYVDNASLDYVYDFMNYMNEIDKAKERGERNDYANGSVLFDFETDFRSPLSFDGSYSSNVLIPLDDEAGEFQRYARSTVGDAYAYSTGGKSVSGTTAGNSNSNSSNILTFSAPSQESSVAPEAAKETSEAAADETAEILISSDAEPASDEASDSDASSEDKADAAAESASESSSSAAPESEAAPAPEVGSAPAPEPEAAPEEPADSDAEASSEGVSSPEEETEAAPAE